MKTFVFQFRALEKYRRHRRDLCRQLVAQVLKELHALRVQQDRLDLQHRSVLDELKQLGGKGDVAIDRAAARRFHAGQLIMEIRLTEQKRNIVQQQYELSRQALAKADQEVKAMEKLREKRWAEFRYEEERIERRELEEVWIARRIAETTR